MTLANHRFLRLATLSGGLMGMLCVVAVAVPSPAMAGDIYTCSSGVLFLNGVSLGTGSYSPAPGVTMSCTGAGGNRVAASFKPPPT